MGSDSPQQTDDAARMQIYLYTCERPCYARSAKALGISLGPQGVTVKTTGLDGTYIDYFNTVHHFGIRVLEDCCLVVIQIGDGQPVFGQAHQIPVQLETVPSHVRLVVDDHLMNYPTSDLMDV